MSAAEIRDKRLVFLVGAPRSGTTWLQLMLASSSAVATVNETHLFSGYMKSLFDAWYRFQNNARDIGVHHFVSDDDYRDLVFDFAAGILVRILAKKPGAFVILEKTPAHIKRWRDILKVFPDAYFLHLIRDPRSVVTSMQAAHAIWGSHSKSPRLIDHCTGWIHCVKQGREIATGTTNYLEVRYEDLKADGQQSLRSIFSWMGIDHTPAECDEILKCYSIERLQSGSIDGAPWDLSAEPQGFFRQGEVDGWASALSPTQVCLVEMMTKDFMSVFGYQPLSQSGLTWRLISLRILLTLEKIRGALHWRARRLTRPQREKRKEIKHLGPAKPLRGGIPVTRDPTSAFPG